MGSDMRSDNVVVLRGRLTSPPRRRELPSGSVLLSLEVTTRAPSTADTSGAAVGAVSVPVVWFDPPTRCRVDPTTPVDTEVVVTGHVRRRYFRAGGTTQSRTEVVADSVDRAGRRRDVERALSRVLVALGRPPDPPG
jgi:single-strand DNA-binding protein